MEHFKRPKFVESISGKIMMGLLVAGLLVGIFLPVTPDQSLTYWTILEIIAGLILLVFIVAGIVEKCWAFTASVGIVLVLILMTFFKVILPNIR